MSIKINSSSFSSSEGKREDPVWCTAVRPSGAPTSKKSCVGVEDTLTGDSSTCWWGYRIMLWPKYMFHQGRGRDPQKRVFHRSQKSSCYCSGVPVGGEGGWLIELYSSDTRLQQLREETPRAGQRSSSSSWVPKMKHSFLEITANMAVGYDMNCQGQMNSAR